jgi:nucleoside phosphorylase
MISIKYKEESYTDISHLLANDILLIITATDIEVAETHKKISPLKGYLEIIKFFFDGKTYYLGRFGCYKTVHAQCSMGSSAGESSILTASNAINLINPKVVLMLGIAFGIDDASQKIGDVLVAETIYPYNNKRVGEKVMYRGKPLNASKTLIDRFKSITQQWEYYVVGDLKSDLIIGPILSGEELIDDKEYRDYLVSQFPTVKGGEMEGNGLYAACEENTQYILVKGICDFADGHKGKNKLENQTIAVNAALSVCLEVFSSKTAFENIGLKSINDNAGEIINGSLTNDLLFDLYTKKNEQYYIQRQIDAEINKSILSYSLWVYGISGSGKSNLIFRNLYHNSIDFVYISLASCVGNSIEEFFKTIYLELLSKIDNETNKVSIGNFQECSKAILNVLTKVDKQKALIIYIEEIPLNDDNEFKEFVGKIASITIDKMFSTSLGNIKFVLSSISNPIRHLSAHQQKVKMEFKFIELTNWDLPDCEKLIDLILSHLTINLPHSTKDKLLNASNRSPRFIKKYFRNVLAEMPFDNTTLEKMISITEAELSQL